MSHGHTHGHSHDGTGDDRAAPQTVRILAALVGLIIAATAVGLVVLWPRTAEIDIPDSLGFPDELVDGTVETRDTGGCTGVPDDADNQCDLMEIRITEGFEEGTVVQLEQPIDAGSPRLEVGDKVVLGRAIQPIPGAPADSVYYFADFQRRTPLTALLVIFAVAVIALGRMQGVRALVALALTLLVVIRFVLPALLQGRSAVAVALVGASVVMTIALYLSHGVNVRTTTALIGTTVSLLLTGALAAAFVGATNLTGLSSEEATFLRISAEQINLQGLLLGGIIIGSLGVLDDVTVTQASAVWELHRADPSLGFRGLYAAAVRIGRDHIASTVNTLVLAYAGASLPLLVLFTQATRNLGDVLTGEVVAIEVVRTLVGSVGLVASVPITTALTALVVGAMPAPSADDATRTSRWRAPRLRRG